MDKKLMKLYKEFQRTAKIVIKKSGCHVPMCFIIKKSGIDLVTLGYKNRQEKNATKDIIKQLIAKQEIEGYCLILDAKITRINKETNEHVSSDAVMLSLYTSKEKLMTSIPYKDKTILTKKIMVIKGRKNQADDWDLWGARIEDTKDERDIIQTYEKIKKDNPQDYQDVTR